MLSWLYHYQCHKDNASFSCEAGVKMSFRLACLFLLADDFPPLAVFWLMGIFPSNAAALCDLICSWSFLMPGWGSLCVHGHYSKHTHCAKDPFFVQKLFFWCFTLNEHSGQKLRILLTFKITKLYLGLTWVTLGYLGLPWVTLGYFGLPWVTLVYLGLTWVTLGYLRLP